MSDDYGENEDQNVSYLSPTPDPVCELTPEPVCTPSPTPAPVSELTPEAQQELDMMELEYRNSQPLSLVQRQMMAARSRAMYDGHPEDWPDYMPGHPKYGGHHAAATPTPHPTPPQ